MVDSIVTPYADTLSYTVDAWGRDLCTYWRDSLGLAEDTLGHDGWRRVTAIQYLRNGSPIAAEGFDFTRVGNIRLSGESRTCDVATGRMTMRAGGSYSYDRGGNLVSWTPSGGSTWTYSYDPLERLVAVRQGGTVVARYAYDVLGRRIVKRSCSGSVDG